VRLFPGVALAAPSASSPLGVLRQTQSASFMARPRGCQRLRLGCALGLCWPRPRRWRWHLPHRRGRCGAHVGRRVHHRVDHRCQPQHSQ
jgi:hypothetical protein